MTVYCRKAVTKSWSETVLSSSRHSGEQPFYLMKNIEELEILLSEGSIKMVANNPEQEEAEEEVSVNYSGEELRDRL